MNWNGLLNANGFAELLPEEYAEFATPVKEALAVFLAGLSKARQAEVVASQSVLQPSARLEEKLAALARCSPVLHKIGQVLARDQRLSEELRRHLRPLESLPPSLPMQTMEQNLKHELGPLESLGLRLMAPAIAEASVAAVIPFQHTPKTQKPDGVFKILKPGIVERMEEDLELLQRVGVHLDEYCELLSLPKIDYQQLFQQVGEKLGEEVNLTREQGRLRQARDFYASEPRVHIPQVFEFCTSKVTSMERIYGRKITAAHAENPSLGKQLQKTLIETLVTRPMLCSRGQALFHGDPHAGNLLWTNGGKLSILDWSLSGEFEKEDRIAVSRLLLAALRHQPQKLANVLGEIAINQSYDRQKLIIVAGHWLQKLRSGYLPGFTWIVGLMDDSVREAHLQFKSNLMLFRKAYYTLQGVVADVGGETKTFDRVLMSEYLQHFLTEWPSRWISWPNSREFATCLSNFDLTKAILSFPNSIARFWTGRAADMWEPLCYQTAQQRS